MSYQDFIASTEENILRTGLSIVGVFGDEENPTFSYSMGLSDRDESWPEVIIVGLAPELAAGVINEVAFRPEPPKAGETLLDVANLPLRVEPVSAENVEAYLCQAVFRQERRGLPKPVAVQLVYPDENMHFPDHAQYSIDPRIQTLLA